MPQMFWGDPDRLLLSLQTISCGRLPHETLAQSIAIAMDSTIFTTRLIYPLLPAPSKRQVLRSSVVTKQLPEFYGSQEVH